ncbi:MAG: DUF4260 domain-containing protein [Parvibaculaceae bacterium]|nr:DUF4260 domain-containing protein [Parvibaculaceae bacterium]
MSHTLSLGTVPAPTKHIEQATKDANTTYVGSVIGFPKLILRVEGLAVLATACFFYARADYSWGLFALLFLVPDISMVGYLVNKQVGSIFYNLAHNYIFPAAMLVYGEYISSEILVFCALIWIAHVGFDRLLGYGLKYRTAFKYTHLSTPS